MKSLLFIIIVGAGICAWCPWLTPAQASALVAAESAHVESGISKLNGCVLTPQDSSLKKVFFGYTENVNYVCTSEDQVVAEGGDTVFVTFYNSVIGTPEPIIK